MKKNQVNAILVNQTKRRNTVFALSCLICVITVLIIALFLIYFERSKEQYVKYNESSNIDYQVLLKQNDFFENSYLESNQQYIASLIDYIKADFNYKLSLEEMDVEYKYSYRIESNVDVKIKGTNNSLYTKTEDLVTEKEKETNEKYVNINEKINIDYNYYNELIKKFVNIYDLENIESTLNINMYVSVIGSCEEFETNDKKESVMTLSIPLTTKTMAIDISDNLINSENNVMQCKSIYENNELFIVTNIILIIINIGLIIFIINYALKTRTAENIYERELKKILNNYSSYIQTLHNDFAFEDYQILKLDTFTDMLEIRDTIRQPILMKQNEEKNGAYFVIPSSTKILYVYRIKVSDIEKEIQNKG